MDILLGQSSSLYQRLYSEGLINDSFGTDYNLEYSYGFSALGGNSKDPEKLADRIQAYMAKVQNEGLQQDDFERIRKKKIGSSLKYLNSPEYIANQFTRYQFNETNLFEIIPMLESIQFEDVVQRLQEHFIPEQFAVCIVK